MDRQPFSPMYFAYSLLLTLGFVLLIPRFILDALRHGKYVAGFRERLGSFASLNHQGRPVIWVHCVSVGETQAARPLVESLRRHLPDHLLVISTITLTGQRLAREVFKDSAAKVFYFPFDWGFTARRALRRINPAAVLLLETELWPGFLRQCTKHEVPVVVVNGRLSDRSFKRYQWVRSFIAPVLRSLELAVMQTREDADRINALGMPAERIFVSGNLKFDASAVPPDAALTAELKATFATGDRPLLLAASTHAPEERIVLEAWRQLQTSDHARPRLLVAPRHPERFAEVASLMAASGFSWTRRTTAGDEARAADLILLDTIGELPYVYSLATIVFVGGSIAHTGGHNLLEPAAVGSCIVTGAHTFNFSAIARTFVEAGAMIQLAPLSDEAAPAELARVFAQLLTDQRRREELSLRSRQLVTENRGATERTRELITPILTQTNKTRPRTARLAAQQVPSA
jgi:3-deoxy-D-manno-octulosonic-acid transferase